MADQERQRPILVRGETGGSGSDSEKSEFFGGVIRGLPGLAEKSVHTMNDEREHDKPEANHDSVERTVAELRDDGVRLERTGADDDVQYLSPVGVDEEGNVVVEVETTDAGENTTREETVPSDIFFSRINTGQYKRAAEEEVSINKSESPAPTPSPADIAHRIQPQKPEEADLDDPEQISSLDKTLEFDTTWRLVPRGEIRQVIEDYDNKKPAEQAAVRLEDLEEQIFKDPEAADGVLGSLDDIQQRLDPEDIDKVEQYVMGLRDAIEAKQNGFDDLEVRKYFEDDLKSKRDKLAELHYKRINSAMRMRLPKNRKLLAEAQDSYDESLRALGRWELADIRGDDDEANEARQIQATELALAEMQELREGINSIEEPERGKTSERRRMIGRVGLLVTSVVGGVGARIGLSAAGIAGGVGAGLVGLGVGGATGATVAGYRAQRDVKRGLADNSSEENQQAETEALAAGIAKGQGFDEALRSYLSAETTKAGRERRLEIGRRIGKGALTGMALGAGGAVVGYSAAAGVEALGNALPESWQFWNGDVNATEGVEDQGQSEADSTSSDQETGETDTEEEVSEPTPTTEELLQQYAGENADAATTIESGEGPYNTFQELGIPEEKWDDLFNNDELMQRLVENGDAYSLQDAGVQEHGFGWSHSGELSLDSVGELYDAADMSSSEAVEIAESGLPPTYAELSPEALTFAETNPAVTNITSGMGGEELMKELRVDPQAWYAIEQDLLKAAPNDFYTLPDGHVGMSHTGSLSANAVEELSKQLNQSNFAQAA